MSSSLVVTLAVIGGVAWLAFLGVSAMRTRGQRSRFPRTWRPVAATKNWRPAVSSVSSRWRSSSRDSWP